MKGLSLPLCSFTDFRLWLLGTATGLTAIHLTLSNRFGDSNFLVLSLLFWAAVFSLIWQKRDRLKLKSGIVPNLLGSLIISVLLIRSTSSPTLNFLGIYPFFAGLGLGLLASGFRHLRQYWQEFIALFFLGVPKAVLDPLVDISVLTAKFATAILWYTGHDVVRQKTAINLAGGSVNVFRGCSGQEGMFYLLGLSILALIVYPLTSRKRWIVPLMAVAIAFIVNGFRVVLMALLVNVGNQQGFDYWHTGSGSLIFSMIAVILFGFFYLFLLQNDPIPNQDAVESDPTL